jgi:lipoprotein NlpI
MSPSTLLRSYELISSGQALCTAQTEVFEIMPNSQYVAPRRSIHLFQKQADKLAITDLTRHFDAQGLINFGLPKDEW